MNSEAVVAPETQTILPPLIRLLNEIALRPPAVQTFLREPFGFISDSEGFIELDPKVLNQPSEKAREVVQTAA